jgi:hypothetical protein
MDETLRKAQEQEEARRKEAHEREETLRKAKEAFILEGQKATIAINGAAAAALLAFLQAVWDKRDTRPLIIGGLIGIIFFAVGVSLGALTYLLRHRAFTYGQRDWRDGQTYRFAYWRVPLASIWCFILGLVLTAVGGFWAVL